MNKKYLKAGVRKRQMPFFILTLSIASMKTNVGVRVKINSQDVVGSQCELNPLCRQPLKMCRANVWISMLKISE